MGVVTRLNLSMKISGLANQWMTRDGLFASFYSEPYTDPSGRLDVRDQMVLELLSHMESLDGNDIYVGTSHSLLNFNTRDVVRGLGPDTAVCIHARRLGIAKTRVLGVSSFLTQA